MEDFKVTSLATTGERHYMIERIGTSTQSSKAIVAVLSSSDAGQTSINELASYVEQLIELLRKQPDHNIVPKMCICIKQLCGHMIYNIVKFCAEALKNK